MGCRSLESIQALIKKLIKTRNIETFFYTLVDCWDPVSKEGKDSLPLVKHAFMNGNNIEK